MDQSKIGEFIKACRKEAKLTQVQLAEKLGITDRAVSKWENGKSLPDVELMLELCSIFDINMNELLSGHLIKMEKYQEQAEQNLVDLARHEKLYNQKLLQLENVIGFGATAVFLVLIFTIGFAVKNNAWRIGLGIFAGIIMIIGTFYAVKLEQEAGYYECPNCHRRYVPSFGAVIMARHIGRKRNLRCPYCGKKAYHTKVLTK